jgi:uncharacterized membrane protein (DUF106 family)
MKKEQREGKGMNNTKNTDKIKERYKQNRMEEKDSCLFIFTTRPTVTAVIIIIITPL